MESSRRMAAVVFGVGLMLTGLPAPSLAELVRVDVTSRVDVLSGKAFGAAGPYEKIWGTAHFAIDPAHPRNQVIADLGLAPREPRRQGRVLGRSLHPQAQGPGPRQRGGLLRRRQPRPIPPAHHVQRGTGRRRPDRRRALRRRVAARAGLHAGRRRLAVRRARGVDRGQGADPERQRTAGQGLGARVVPARQAGRRGELDGRQRHQGLSPRGRERPRLPADRARRHVRGAAAGAARRLAVRPCRRRHATSPTRSS